MIELFKWFKFLGFSNGMQNVNLFVSMFVIGGWLDEGVVVLVGYENYGV